MNKILTNRKYLLGLFLLLSSFLQAQTPVARFIGTPTEGCAPLPVQFTDQSTGNPTKWIWDLGNGTPVDTLNKNPGTIYLNPGTYPVKLTVSNANGSDDTTIYVTVFDKPKPDFTVSSKSGCAPFSPTFKDLSVSQPGDPIVKWDWDFGDGGPHASGPNPTYTFLTPGTYNITLTDTSSHGCSDMKGQTGYITVLDPLNVSFGFSFVGGKSCKPPQTIQFAGASTTGPGTLSYSWNFGDGSSTSFGASTFTSHQYLSAGTFSPALIVKNNFGCIDSVVRKDALIINGIKSSISGPDTVCVNSSATFSNSSNPLPTSYYWDLGNGVFSSDAAITKTFDTIGTYTIKTISSYGSCTDTASKTISVIGLPVVSFKADDSASCKVPFTVNFTDLTPSATQWQWDFGDGSGVSPSTNPSTSHTYTSLPANGIDTVKLIVTDTHGCSNGNPASYLIKIQEPVIKFSTAEGGGCIPYIFKPIPDTSGVVDGVKSYLWDFGTTPVSTSTDAHPSYTYTALGRYDIKLTVTTNDGCTATSVVTEGVKIGAKPIADFNAVSTKACGGSNIQFTDLSTPALSKPDDKWLWNFGDDSTSSDQNPSHAFKDTGKFNIKLIVWNDGCPDTITKTNYITIDPAVAKFKPIYDCVNKNTVTFSDSSISALTWKWDFDGDSIATTQNTTHTFSQYKSYTVKLIVTNGSCSDTSTQVVTIINEIPDFISSKDSICRKGTTSFTATGVNTANIKDYIWDFGDGKTDTTLIGVASHQYDSAGIFAVKLSVTDANGCINMITKAGKIHVFSPKANFKYSITAACADSIVTFTDLSTTADGNNNIAKWKWKYGDNKTDSFVAPLPAAITHSYSTEGKYFPKLIITDAVGCVDSVTYISPLIVSKPFAALFVDRTKTCNNDTLNFSASNSTGNSLTYKWDFGDNTTSTVLRPQKFYTSNGKYDIKLVVTDIYGCSATSTYKALIDVKQVKAGFTASSTYGTCIPFYVNFRDTSLNETYRLWSFGDGITSARWSDSIPSHPYVTSGNFHVKLTASRGTEGIRTICVDTATINIVVNAPTATLTYSPLEGCAPLEVKFNVTSASQLTYSWDFGSGETSNPTITSDTTHLYSYANNFTPVVIIEDPSGCKIPIVGKQVIKVYGSNVNFKADTTLVCDNGFVKFTNLSVSNGPIAGYLWSFGDGGTSNLKDPSHNYSGTGYYNVSLIIKTVYGCEDTLVKTAYIRVAKKPSISIDAISEYCGPSTATFKGILLDSDGSPLTWKWNFGNGNSSDLQNPPAQQYTNATTYPVTLIGKSPSGCTDTANTNINIHPIPTVFAGNDTVICLNTTAQLFATGADTFSWQPTSSLSCTNCNNPVANPTDNITYTVTGKTVFGCTDTDEISIEVKKPFTLTGLQPLDSVCLGKSIRLNVSGAENYSWSPADGLNNISGASVVASPTTNTIYKVVGTDSKNCFFDSAFIDLKVNPNPTVNAGADMVLHLGNSIQLSIQNSPDVYKWLWTPATGLSCSTCPAPIATPETNTAYIITVSNSSKCTASDEVFIKVVCDNSNLFLPTAFTPNGDGLNDVFYPMGVGLFKIQSLRIFNRYGQVVFEKSNFNANDRSAGWDGSYKGKTSDPAAYIYTLEVICKNNEVLTINGKILLIQ